MMLSTWLSAQYDAFLDLISQLTSAGSLDELLQETSNLFKTHLTSFTFSVVETTITRQPGPHGRNTVLCLPCLTMEKATLIHKKPELYTAYCLRKPYITTTVCGTNYKLIVPVVLCDRNVSHLISIEHKNKADLKAMTGLAKIIRDLIRMHRERSADPLTRVLNRQAMDQFLAALSNESRQQEVLRYIPQPIRFIAILDIDHFKHVNDNYGHHIGDEILMLFTQTVRSAIRQHDLLFRYGGEEFVLFFCTDKVTDGERILTRCRKAVEQQYFPQIKHLTVSIGYAMVKKGSDPHIQLDLADKALFYAKTHGRNQVQNYDVLIKKKKLTPPAPPADTHFLM